MGYLRQNRLNIKWIYPINHALWYPQTLHQKTKWLLYLSTLAWRDLKKAFDITVDASSNNQMIVLLIIRNLGGLKKIRPERPTKIGRNDPGWNNPGPKRLRAETTRNGTYQEADTA